MPWRANFWYLTPDTMVYKSVDLPTDIGLFQQKFDPEKVVDATGKSWFKRQMNGEPDFVWVEKKDESTAER